MKSKNDALKINKIKKSKRFENLDVVIFLGPFLVVFFVFTILPVFISLFISLTNFNMLEFPDLVGLANYEKLFLNDDIFSLAMQNTLILALITGPLSYIMCFAFAWLINEVPPKPRAFLTLLFYAPSLAGGFAYVWQIMFSGDSYGYINGFLMGLGIISDPILWLKDETWMFTVCVIIVLWQALGTTFLTFIAGLQTVDRSLCTIDQVDVAEKFAEAVAEIAEMCTAENDGGIVPFFVNDRSEVFADIASIENFLFRKRNQSGKSDEIGKIVGRVVVFDKRVQFFPRNGHRCCTDEDLFPLMRGGGGLDGRLHPNNRERVFLAEIPDRHAGRGIARHNDGICTLFREKTNCLIRIPDNLPAGFCPVGDMVGVGII